MIGTLAAIGLGLAGAGAAAGAISSGNAANKATQVAQDTASQNNALARDIYGQNKGILSPAIGRGDAAGGTLNALLGLGGTGATSGQPDYAAYVQSNPDLQTAFQQNAAQFGNDPAAFGQYHYQTYGQNEGRQLPSSGGASGVTQQDAQNSFRSYLDNSNYAFDLGQGLNKVNSGFAGAGTLQSGAAMKGIEDYRQNLQQDYRGEYMNALGNQQGVGLSAGSALAGVGQNYVNTLSANNNSAGTTAANAALYKAQNSPFNALSLLGGGLFGYGK